jgi:hypothetical protein
VQQGWSEQPLLTLAGIIIGGALLIAAIRWMFGKK